MSLRESIAREERALLQNEERVEGENDRFRMRKVRFRPPFFDVGSSIRSIVFQFLMQLRTFMFEEVLNYSLRVRMFRGSLKQNRAISCQSSDVCSSISFSAHNSVPTLARLSLDCPPSKSPHFPDVVFPLPQEFKGITELTCNASSALTYFDIVSSRGGIGSLGS